MEYINIIFRFFFYRLISLYIKYRGIVKVGESTLFKRMPHIIKNKSAQIFIGNNTIINSSNKGYHLNMFAKCKIYADRPHSVIKIGDNCRIHGACIHAYNEITIGNNCLIAANTQIIDGNGHQLSMENPNNRINTTDNGKPIIIEDNVWIGTGCIILGGTTIGTGSIISAGSIIKGNIPAMSLYGGNPAKLIKQY